MQEFGGSLSAPGWAEESADAGPLFAEAVRPDDAGHIEGHRDALLEPAFRQPAPAELRWDWHLTARDFADEPRRQRLLRLARAALAGAPIRFVCDRPRRAVALAEGLDRRQPALLQWVTLHLPALLQRTPAREPELFLTKLLSLARLGASAGVQKRDFIRRHGRPERPAFLLDQAHVGLHLAGVAEVVRVLFSEPVWSDRAVAFLQHLRRHLQETLDREAKSLYVPCVVDDLPEPAPADGGVPWKARLRLAGRLHAGTGRGTVDLPLAGEPSPEPAELVDLLHYAWKHTSVSRIRTVRLPERQTQLTVGWAEEAPRR